MVVCVRLDGAYRRPVADAGTWQAETIRSLTEAGLDPAEVAAVIDLSLAEDFRDGPDITTTSTVPADAVGEVVIASRQDGVLSGAPVAMAVFDAVSAGRVSGEAVADGTPLSPGTVAISLRGPMTDILMAERTALNLLGHLTGVASATRRWVQAVAGTGARIRDTRKTLPGLRDLEKYAVRCGGGVNHRMSLGDAALIKDNHVASAGSVAAAIEAVRRVAPQVPMEVEVDDLAQFDEAVAAGAGLIMLDNFSIADTVEAVRRRDAVAPTVKLEASGGLTLDRAAEVAATGVDFIAVGALTHSAPVADLGLDVRSVRRPG